MTMWAKGTTGTRTSCPSGIAILDRTVEGCDQTPDFDALIGLCVSLIGFNKIGPSIARYLVSVDGLWSILTCIDNLWDFGVLLNTQSAQSLQREPDSGQLRRGLVAEHLLQDDAIDALYLNDRPPVDRDVFKGLLIDEAADNKAQLLRFAFNINEIAQIFEG